MTTKKKPDTLAHHMPHNKWTALREKERITRLSVPHVNATMSKRYDGAELDYRGRGTLTQSTH